MATPSPVKLTAAIGLWYAALTILLGFYPSQPLDFGLAFNSMAEHLLHGQFDIDPDAIGAEAFESNGHTVAYFGIFCALLRIPLVLLPGFARTGVTWWSCLTAMWLGTWLQLRAICLIWPGPDEAGTRRAWLVAGLFMSMLLAGPHVQFLRPSIFQEPVNWASAQAMGFIFLALRGFVTPRGFDRRTLGLMAFCAGLALITRVSFGIGLYAALGFLLLVRGNMRSWLVPGAILLAFAIVTGIVNQGRWGNPLVFADFSKYGLSQDVDPGRLGRLAAYGAFNPIRIPLTLGYYFVPIWIWIRTDGHVLFAETQATLMDAMELPAGSFLLTDPLLLILALTGVVTARDRARAALLLGLATPPVLMLCAISTAHRYRMEFYPFLFLAALFGVSAPHWRLSATRRFQVALICCVAASIAAAHAMDVLYAWTAWGPGEFYLERYGPIGMYSLAPR